MFGVSTELQFVGKPKCGCSTDQVRVPRGSRVETSLFTVGPKREITAERSLEILMRVEPVV